MDEHVTQASQAFFEEEEEPTIKYRHSLFFENEEDAIQAKLWVDEWIDTIDKDAPAYDDDGGLWEVRFLTTEKMTTRERNSTIRQVPIMVTYSFNAEDYS